MNPIIRTHTYFMTFREYKKRFLKNNINYNDMRSNNNIMTRTHIFFI